VIEWAAGGLARTARATVARARRPLAALALVAVSAFVLAACGSSNDDNKSGSASASASTGSASSASKCGTKAAIGPANPSGVYASLTSDLKKVYESYPDELTESAWANFKKKPGPWQIGLIGFPSVNDYFKDRLAGMQEEFAKAKDKGLVSGSLVTSIPGSAQQMTPEAQVSAIQRMVRQGVDAILLEPAGGNADRAAIDAAGKAGVPVVMAGATMPGSKYAQVILPDNYSNAISGALGKIQKGKILIVRGAQGNTLDEIVYKQGQADLKNCPDIDVAGTVFGAYDDTTAKTVVQQFLASHPQPLAGAITQGGMFAGTVQAIQAVGKDVPPIAMVNPGGGALSWWLQHQSDYNTVGQALNGHQTAYTYFDAALRILAGKGPRFNVLMIPAPTITNDNLSQYAPAGKPLTYPGPILGDGPSWCGASCLDPYFKEKGDASGS
jgi:ABC-type sugar transport system substrate-binding protein